MLTIHLGRIFFLGRLRIVWCVGNEDIYLKVFEDKRLVQDSSTTLVYIFHIAVNVSRENIIHTANFEIRNSNVVNDGHVLQRKLKETIILNKYDLKWKETSEKCKWEHRTR